MNSWLCRKDGHRDGLVFKCAECLFQLTYSEFISFKEALCDTLVTIQLFHRAL